MFGTYADQPKRLEWYPVHIEWAKAAAVKKNPTGTLLAVAYGRSIHADRTPR